MLSFHIILKHSGVSYYLLMEKEYLTYNSVEPFRYSFEEIGNSTEVKNVVQHQFERKGDALLSPYTLWTFQIIKALPRDPTVSFEKLRKFAGQVDLALEGYGICVDENNSLKEDLARLDLEKYYTPFTDGLTSFAGRANLSLTLPNN